MIKQLISSAFFATVMASSSHLIAVNPQPYTNVRNLSYVPYFLENAYLLSNAINTTSGSVFIDVGSQDGAAARWVAQNYANVTNYAVNAWWSCDSSQKNLFQKFLSNVIQENTANIIVPIRMSSTEGAKALSIVADVIYLESSSQNLSADILCWFNHLSTNGILCGNDWSDPFVEASVSQAAIKLGYQVNSNGDFWSIQKN